MIRMLNKWLLIDLLITRIHDSALKLITPGCMTEKKRWYNNLMKEVTCYTSNLLRGPFQGQPCCFFSRQKTS